MPELHDKEFKAAADVCFLESLAVPASKLNWEVYATAFDTAIAQAKKAGWNALDLCINNNNDFADEMKKRYSAVALRILPNYQGSGIEHQYLRIRFGSEVAVANKGQKEPELEVAVKRG